MFLELPDTSSFKGIVVNTEQITSINIWEQTHLGDVIQHAVTIHLNSPGKLQSYTYYYQTGEEALQMFNNLKLRLGARPLIDTPADYGRQLF